LQARLPVEFSVIPVSASDVGNGSVVGCLTAQANAGGNEQLWKPLNHAVLSEVKKAGLVSLLSLMISLGG